VRTARALAEGLGRGLPQTAVVCAATADHEGYSVETVGQCPAGGRFELGSITKTMTGIVLASLADDGIVHLDDEIGRWLDAGDNAGITLEQLATHTSGLPRLSPSHVLGAPDPYAFLTADVAEAELRRTPGRPRGVERDYSNFGFQVLGLVLERADRAAFADLLQHRILDPLGMTCSGVPGHGGGTTITGYAHGAPAKRWNHHLPGAGGAEASPEDMARYLMACLNPPDSQVGWAIKQAQRPHVEIDPLRSAGLGWPIGPPGYLGHDGGTAGFRSMLGINRPGHRAAAVLVNTRDARGLASAVRQALESR
jgi:serine-type D-Ala-D-Ala carboxypeptidase/endopeptidase